MAQELNVGIIGGGYAGMAAAALLSQQGIPVTVFESARQLGGRARGVIYQQTELDNGQHLLLGCYHETLRLIELVGGDIQQDFLRIPMQLKLHNHFSLTAHHLPAPIHLVTALLFSQGLSFPERLHAAWFMIKMRLNNFQLNSDTTVSQLLETYQQSINVIQKLWEPLCVAALNTPIQKASAQVLLNVMRDSFGHRQSDSDMLLPKKDLTVLFPGRAASFIKQRGGRVLLAQGVKSIHIDENQIQLKTEQNIDSFSHVICAASPTVALRLFNPIPELNKTVAQIKNLEHQPIYTVYLQYPDDVTLPSPMLGFHKKISQWLFDKGQIDGHLGLIAVVISAEGIHQNITHEALTQKVIVELREELSILSIPRWTTVIAEKRATFCCRPNLPRPSQSTIFPHLLLAGDYTTSDYPATLEGAIRSGVKCAQLLLGQLSDIENSH